MTLMQQSQVSGHVERLLGQLRGGDSNARTALIDATVERMREWTRQFKKDHRRHPLAQTEDVFQNAVLALWQALQQVEINDAQHFFRLAAKKIRHSLLDLSRQLKSVKYKQRHLESLVENSDSDGDQAGMLEPAQEEPDSRSSELHEIVEGLPDDERAVVDILYYHGFNQQEAAAVLGVDVRTVRRRWRRARLALVEQLSPEAGESFRTPGEEAEEA